ncbi:MAG TPA: sterol desaturase family protein [Rhizomicrobium sp.]|jgi:sterol desaturase/sphingolipid hydroxylase (fatty acid hydroxylase superfamily)|nr:sterol desaturase family protein [Rhizomicrobium sp.]
MPCNETQDTSAHLAASPRLFRNPLLDKFSRVHASLPFLIYVPTAALLLWAARGLPVRNMIVTFAIGYLLWTLLEYFGHRFIFHIRPKSSAGAWIQFLIHGVHHQHPSDPLRLVMPPIMSLPIMAGTFALLRLAAGPVIDLSMMSGFLAGYLIYDGVHFYVHHRHPANALGRYLRRRHMHHHFREDTSWFGVSAPWWDAIFATRPGEKAAHS